MTAADWLNLVHMGALVALVLWQQHRFSESLRDLGRGAGGRDE